MEQTENSTKRPCPDRQSVGSQKKRKLAAFAEVAQVDPKDVSGWQAALGSSLADQLEQLTVKRNLTARQVKKLLRAVLTNEDVVSVFRRYINLSEPETGELSKRTKRRVKNLSLLRGSDSSQPPVLFADQPLEPRVVTRSLARTIQHSLRDYLPVNPSNSCKQPSTILDMEFSDEDDGSQDETTREPLAVRDEDYQPGPFDLYILERDNMLDQTLGRDPSLDASRSRLEESTPSVQHDEDSNESSASNTSSTTTNSSASTNSATHVDMDQWLCNDDPPEAEPGNTTYTERLRSSRLPTEMSDKPIGSPTKPLGSALSRQDTGSDVTVKSTGALETDVEPIISTPAFNTPLGDTVEDADDGEDDVYAEFLRSLFASGNSAHTSPQKKARISPNGGNLESHRTGHGESDQTSDVMDWPPLTTMHSPSALDQDLVRGNRNKEEEGDADDEDDDPDDPEFDVMAELDQVNREDFFDELRDDRAVRVSKQEAKTLHRDLQDLFSDEDDDGQGAASNKPAASAVYAITSHCHRLLHANRAPKLEPVDLEAEEQRGSSPGTEEPGGETSTSINKRLSRALNHMQPIKTLTESQVQQLQRQLGMHIQLLTTNFLCTYDFTHLHQSVTRVCASALKELASRRDAFDLMAQQRSHSIGACLQLTSFYRSCPTLDEAVQLITDYAGLSFLPLIPRNPDRSSVSTQSAKASKVTVTPTIPLPHCLIQLMANNRIWSYPYLMPTSLPSIPEPLSSPQCRRRLSYHSAEDALILLGMADFSGTYIPPEPASDEPQFHHNRYLTYRLIQKHLLPHRNLLQLRTRRWSLLSTHSSHEKLMLSKNLPLATQRLILLFAGISSTSPLDKRILHKMADEVAPSSIPRQIPLRLGCLSELPYDALFRRDGLPRHGGYEMVLLNVYNERPCRGELSKKIHDLLTDFAQQAQCLWWSHEPNRSDSMKPDWSASPGPIAIKPEEGSSSESTLRDTGLLGPTFLPAIPVDFTPDGQVVVNTNLEPALVEFDAPSDSTARIHGTKSTAVPCQSNHCMPILRDTPKPSIADHIETVLAQVRKWAAQEDRNAKRRNPSELTSKTLRLLASASPVAGKLPLPRLPTNTSTQHRALMPRPSDSLRQSVADDLPPKARISTNNVQQGTDDTISPRSSISSSRESNSECNLSHCQKAANFLADQFHFGLDKVVYTYGDSVWGPSKFQPISKPPSSSNDCTSQPYSSTFTNLQAPTSQPDGSNNQQSSSVFSGSCFLTPARFLNRCKARGEATTADLFTLPSSVLPQRQSTLDELDVHRARSLLDRCRAYLSPTEYGNLILTLRELNRIVYGQDSSTFSSTQRHKAILHTVASVLQQLRGRRALWEDFLSLLAAEQAKDLGLLTTFRNLTRIDRVQRVLQGLVPRGKRFWRRLRNLADSVWNEDAPALSPAIDSTVGNNSGLKPAMRSMRPTDRVRLETARTRFRLLRRKGVRTKLVRSPLSKTWSFLESAWRNRPILMSQLACILNSDHKPYSGFEQGFEEIDLLSRHSLDTPTIGYQELDSVSFPPKPIPVDSPLLTEGWEVSTVLSAATRRRRLGSSSSTSAHRTCPCPCHPSSSTSAMGNTTTGKASKLDNLGRRHCISCGLRVQRGIVYMDEYNLHLRNVEIIWPPDFKPKASLLPSTTNKSRTTSESNSQPAAGRSATNAVPGYLPTRTILAQFAELHAQVQADQNTDNPPSFTLPDIAKRRVSIEFLRSRKTDPVQQHHSVAPTEETTTFQETNLLNGKEGVSPQSTSPATPGTPVRSPLGPTSPTHLFLHDDDAACFNTEAFASTSVTKASPSSYDPNMWTSTSSAPTLFELDSTVWHPDEDRQLLEFSKARGRYSSSMFVDLAQCWVPKPELDSRPRTALELEARFKKLMQLTLGDAYDSDLFLSPERVESDQDM